MNPPTISLFRANFSITKMSIISEYITFELVAILTTLIAVVVAYFKWKQTYWEKVGVPTLTPTIPFGNAKGLILGRKTFGEQVRDIYIEFRKKGYTKHGGMYFGTKPFYIPMDPTLIKHILQTDFQHFVNHGNYIDEETDPLSGNLFGLEDAKWRNLRIKLTPTFTSGKMKMMFQTLADCTVGLKHIVDDFANTRTPLDIKDILGRFTTDIIGSAAFGLECNSLKDPNAIFRKYGKRVFEVSSLERFKFLLPFILPHSILHALKFKFTKTDVEKFFMKVVNDTVSYREQNDIYRKDFMHLLLQLKNRGVVTDDEKVKDENGKIQESGLTMNELAAQSFVFFVAGFETSSTLMTFTLYELARNPDVQEKLREEINAVLKKHDGKMTYDAIMDMSYLEKVLYESLRKYPPVSVLPRVCTKDYTIPNTSIVIKKGINVFIPTLALHTDEEYYPDPEKFDPERFSTESKNSRPSFTWLPFGEGPRICIGLRFGLMQSKVGITTILSNYKIKLSNKTQLPLELEKKVFITTAKGGIWLDVEKLE